MSELTQVKGVHSDCEQVFKSIDDCVVEKKITSYPYVPSHTCVSGTMFGPGGAFEVYCHDWDDHDAVRIAPEPIVTTVYELNKDALEPLQKFASKSADAVRTAYDLYVQLSSGVYTATDKIRLDALKQVIPTIISANGWKHLGAVSGNCPSELRKIFYEIKYIHGTSETFKQISDCLAKSAPDFAKLYNELLSTPENQSFETPTPRELMWERKHAIEHRLIPDSNLDEIVQLDIKANYGHMLPRVQQFLKERLLKAKSLPEERAVIVNKLKEASKRSFLTEEYALFRKTAQVLNAEYCSAIIERMSTAKQPLLLLKNVLDAVDTEYSAEIIEQMVLSKQPLVHLKEVLGEKLAKYPFPEYECLKPRPKELELAADYNSLHRYVDATFKIGAFAGIGAGFFLNEVGDINSVSNKMFGGMFAGMLAGMFAGSVLPRLANGLLGLIDDFRKESIVSWNSKNKALQSRNATRVEEYLAEIFPPIHSVYSQFTIPRQKVRV